MTLPARLPHAVINQPPGRPASGGPFVAAVSGLSERVRVVLDALSPGTRLPPLVVWCCGTVLLGVLGQRMGGPVVAALLVVGSGALPVFGPAGVRRRNTAAARRMLPERVAAVARSLRSGSMLPEALGNAFPVGEPGTENWVVGLQQVALGRPIDDVLADLAGDAGAQERLLIAVLRMGQRSGGRLAASLESVAERLAEEVDLVDRRRVLTTQARVSGQVLAALPVVFATVLAVLRGGTAYTGTIGQSSLIGGLVLNVAGLGWMRRQLRVLQ